MLSLQFLLIGGVLAVFLAWVALSIHVLAVQHRRARSVETVSAVVRTLALDRGEAGIAPLLANASRTLVMRAATEPNVSQAVFDGLTVYFAERWGIESLVRDASSHRGAREQWRRMAALRMLFRLDYDGIVKLLDGAVAGTDAEVASVAFSLLGQSSDAGAIDVLLAALRSQQHPASRVAIHLEHSPQRFAHRLQPLLHDHDPVMRLWSATLLGRYPDVDGLEEALTPLTEDPDPRVRKAAIASLGKVGGDLAASSARRLLTDSAPFVRAHAARALGELDRSDLASDVADLLSDRDWWVRRAAKDALEMMGSDVWPVLVHCLDHPDAFVRNGAAEVFQNLGILDSLIIMEAVTDNPSDAKIAMLRRITVAGGGRLTDSLIERSGPALRPRVRQLLTTIGLQQVGAH